MNIAIKRGLEDFQPEGIAFTFSNGKILIANSTSKNYQIRVNDSNYGMLTQFPGSGQEKDYIINLSDLGNPKEVAVAVIVQIGKGERICDISERLTNIQPC